MAAALAASTRARFGSMLVGIGVVIMVLGVVMAATQLPAQAQSTNPNDASYWEALYTEHSAQCFKHDPPDEDTVHGYLNDAETAVILNPFNQAWPGDHWEVLIVKAGSSGGDDGNGNNIYPHPTAGVEYFAPFNSGGQQAEVSHWIVCKGTTPDTSTTTSTDPTTTTSTDPTTTTTSTSSTTTSTSTTTTSTLPPSTTSTSTSTTSTSTSTSTTSTSTTTTSTLPPSTTSTSTSTTSTSSTLPPSTTSTSTSSTSTSTTLPPTTTSTLPPELPRTGGTGNSVVILFGGLGLALAGAGLLMIADERRRLRTPIR